MVADWLRQLARAVFRTSPAFNGEGLSVPDPEEADYLLHLDEQEDRALAELTWEDRQRAEAAIAMGDYGTPLEEVLRELGED